MIFAAVLAAKKSLTSNTRNQHRLERDCSCRHRQELSPLNRNSSPIPSMPLSSADYVTYRIKSMPALVTRQSTSSSIAMLTIRTPQNGHEPSGQPRLDK